MTWLDCTIFANSADYLESRFESFPQRSVTRKLPNFSN